MKFVAITGGLGNQMFIYAFAEELKRTYKDVVLYIPYKHSSKSFGHQGYELNKLFGIKASSTLNQCLAILFFKNYERLGKFLPKKWKMKFLSLYVKIREVPENFIFYPDVLKELGDRELYKGTWQSPLYFENSVESLRHVFQFNKQLLSTETIRVSEHIKVNNSISIHIRRGDYLSDQYSNGFAGVCTTEYYDKAFRYMLASFEEVRFYVFTDDPEWVNSNFRLENAIYIQHNAGSDSWQDMYLMSQCKHNIIANSSFSWWGAWLNANPDKVVIAPSKWWRLFEKDDVVPQNWIRI